MIRVARLELVAGFLAKPRPGTGELVKEKEEERKKKKKRKKKRANELKLNSFKPLENL